MEKESNLYGEELVSWEIPEFEKHERTTGWYIGAVALTILLLIYATLTFNLLFALIIILSAFIIILRDKRGPDMVKFALMSEGIMLGRMFYDYDELKHFSVIYKPHLEVRNIYIEFKNSLKHRLSIPLENQDPLIIRDNLLKYLPEDLERTDAPVSEGLGRIFKL